MLMCVGVVKKDWCSGAEMPGWGGVQERVFECAHTHAHYHIACVEGQSTISGVSVRIEIYTLCEAGTLVICRCPTSTWGCPCLLPHCCRNTGITDEHSLHLTLHGL